ncbi:MAG: hypothetical protein R2712_31935 [Vicinamibacterales bacterium]
MQGEVTLRLGTGRGGYAGIRKDVVHVAGRIALADEAGPLGTRRRTPRGRW